MIRRLRIATFALPVVALLCAAAPASATRHKHSVPGCDNPADSALNQYCETFPASGGKQRPSVGTPAVAPSLAPAILHQLESSRSGRRLLRLPRGNHLRSPGALSSRASTGALPWWMFLIIALLALALVGGAAGERRRRHAQQRE